ncbi:membrane protein required for colicin V production [Robiginitalea myxolifaciens]|uniref:Membrane protein required for colicin V production n=1 Tax=Robiginitalea myxolifaciens TaxID=400055 RepID=A0A1I6G5V5_9FLAO|nr:CvpA family protein [Robiginitalea myxolifaciens]SFR37565.1 membrane protein required for colicin V production [Robiginitalea myxolifaciens]
MGLLDIILGALLALGLYKGLKNGLFLELASIIALIAGIYGAIHFSYITADYLSERVNWELRTLKIAAFIITFLCIVGVVHLLGKALTKVADFAFVGWLNKLAGGVFGVLKAAVILGAILIFFDRANSSLNVVKSDYIANSVLYAPLMETGAFVFDWVLEPDRRKPADFSAED